MITTGKIKLTSNYYFKILLLIILKKKWWWLILIAVLGLFMLSEDNRDSRDLFFTIYIIVLPIYLIINAWRFANSKDNKLFLIERYFNIYEDKIVGILDDGSESSIKLENFIKVLEFKEFYLLYISKTQYIYIPKSSFKSLQDKEWFNNEIVLKIKY